MLRKHPKAPVSVYAIWEPILDTDTAPPNLQTLERLYDPRVRQYWDPNHAMAAQLYVTQVAAGIEPHCCIYEKTFLWDLIAIFPRAARWQSAPPAPSFFDGTVIKQISALDAALSR